MPCPARTPRLRLPLGLILALLLAAPVAAQTLDHHKIRIGAETRSFALYVPPAVARSKTQVPLVLVLHGGAGNGASAARMSGFSALARREGFIVAYPNGSGRREDRLLTWNAGKCCGYAMRNKVDDVAFLATLIDHLIRTRPVDARRVYVTGMSNGAMMTHRAAAALPGRIAAAAPVAGGLFGSEPRPRGAVPVLTINGSEDKAVPAEGGAPGGRVPRAFAPGARFAPWEAQGDYWARANGCRIPARIAQDGKLTLRRYACPDGAQVVQIQVVGTGHAWPGGRGTPGGDDPGRTIDATATIWRFFSAHRN